jgi:ribonuclease T2
LHRAALRQLGPAVVKPRGLFRGDYSPKARAMVKIPPEYTDLQDPLNVTPAAVEAAFIKANPNLSTESMAIESDNKRLIGVRICLSKELQFRSCAQIARRSCRREQLIMPPQR